MLDFEVSKVFGVKKERASKLNKLGIFTVYDLINYFPKDYEDRSEIKSVMETSDGDKAVIRAVIIGNISYRRVRNNLDYIKFEAADNSGKLNLTFFNQKYLLKELKTGEEYVFFGKIKRSFGKTEMVNPSVEKGTVYNGGITPLYSLTKGLSQKVFQNIEKSALSCVEPQLKETLPQYLKEKYRLCDNLFAYNNIHFPADIFSLKLAKKRLVFEELLFFQLGLLYLKNSHLGREGIHITDFKIIDEFVKMLPFELTAAQKRVTNDILRDMKNKKQLNRLVQGDVGSGKTVVACMAMLVMADNGFQSAMMAPTEILAVQHYESLKGYFDYFGIKSALLTGSTSAKNKAEILAGLESGEIKILIGTHAIIEDNVKMKNFGLCITDEQHRFGVKQRNLLAGKGNNPHMLVMTATPIPRTLALILYTDLDLSVIDELPPGRIEIETVAASEKDRGRINRLLSKELAKGNQIYAVCPLVEESENMDGDIKNVVEYKEVLEKTFPGYCVELLHGKMKPKEKDEIMMRFKNNEINILVSTTVIEVGVNVPNATVMLIENAERFGLSQLHQLRGRVGRGNKKSYTVLVSDSTGRTAKERLKIMTSTTDGFKISEKDLELRGPGDFFGTEQSGFLDMKIANLLTDIRALSTANEEAKNILEKDPELKLDENRLLKESVKFRFGKNKIEVFN